MGFTVGREGSAMSELQYKSRVRVSAVVFDADHRVLLVRQFADSDFWLLPGGGAEPGELTRDAVVREVLEETGFSIAPERLLWVTESMIHGRESVVHHINACYLGHEIGQRSGTAEHEWGFFDRDCLPSDNVSLPPNFWTIADRGFRDYDPGVSEGHHRVQ